MPLVNAAWEGLGAGTIANPYQISNCTLLQNMTGFLNANFSLTSNINCSDTVNWRNNGTKKLGFWPIGNISNNFNGNLEGNNYQISELYSYANYSITWGSDDYKNSSYRGLFGYIKDARIKNLFLHEFDITGKTNIGLLVGYARESDLINISVNGNILAGSYIGGLVGYNYNSSITNCSSDINILATRYDNGGFTAPNNFGGLIGQNVNRHEGYVNKSVSKGKITNFSSSLSNVGGLVGYNAEGNIYLSYSEVNITGNNILGGLIGKSDQIGVTTLHNINNSYSNGTITGANSIGGFIASSQYTNIANSYTNSVIINSTSTNIGCFVGTSVTTHLENYSKLFYNSDLCTKSDTRATAKTTAELKTQSTFTGWDFTTIWVLHNSRYPEFVYMNEVPTIPTTLSLTTPVYIGSTLEANATGSTDPESDTITYYYEFFNIDDNTTRQAYSTDNTYIISISDKEDEIRVRVKGYDGLGYSRVLSSDINVSTTYNTINFYNEETLLKIPENYTTNLYIYGDNLLNFSGVIISNSTYIYGAFNPDIYTIEYNISSFENNRYIDRFQAQENLTYSLYALPNSISASQVRLRVKNGLSYEDYPNIIVKLQRFYPSLGSWITVQMDKSGEYGYTYFNVKEATTDYRFLFYDSNLTLLLTSNQLKFGCSSGICDLTAFVKPAGQSSVDLTYLKYVSSLGNTTENGTINWTTSDGNNHIVNVTIYKPRTTTYTKICSSQQTAAASSLGCNLTGYYGEVLIRVSYDNLPFESFYIKISKPKLENNLGKGDSVFFAMAIFITLIGVGLYSPLATIVFGIVGLIIISSLGLLSAITITSIMLASIIGMLLGYKIRK